MAFDSVSHHLSPVAGRLVAELQRHGDSDSVSPALSSVHMHGHIVYVDFLNYLTQHLLMYLKIT